MSSCFTVIGNMCTNGINGYEHNVYPYTISTSTFTMYTRNTDSKAFSWLAVGKQQWGFKHMSASGTHSNTTITYPIAFNTQCYSVASTREGTSADGTWNAVISNLTTTTFLCQLKIGLYWLAVGKQQWGWWDDKSGSLSFSYPIAFTSTVCAIATSGINSGTVDMHISSSPLPTTTGAAMATTNSKFWVSCYWIAVGIQQWGYVEDTSARTISLQIALAKNLYCVVADESISASSLIKTTTSFTIYTSGAAWGRYAPQKFHWVAIGFQQWGIWNNNRSAGQIQCTFPVANTKETLAILATYFDNTDVSNGAILIKETTLSACTIKLWSYTKISFWVIGYQSYKSTSYCSPKSIYVIST